MIKNVRFMTSTVLPALTEWAEAADSLIIQTYSTILKIFSEISPVYLKTSSEVQPAEEAAAQAAQHPDRGQASAMIWKYHLKMPYTEQKLRFHFSTAKPVKLVTAAAAKTVQAVRPVLHVRVLDRSAEVQVSSL